ncbi:MAG TPA: type I methionyl aminopeptidase [Candidatus Woesebacteria bacterium]|nr:type I methionyl aminopeptidase [Candidatus Woesebacteria bacterium]
MRDKVEAMWVGGKALAEIKTELQRFVKVGTSFFEIEALAQKLIQQKGMLPSFSTVPGYDWATCIMRNDALCHGIPTAEKVKDGDIVSIDVGLINQGYHLDTSISFGVGTLSAKKHRFLADSLKALNTAIALVRPGQTVYALSRAIETSLHQAGLGAVYQLTGHGVGKNLHEEPAIPCVADPGDKKILLSLNQTIAVEVMSTMGRPDLTLDSDGWTYRTKDGSLSAMFEETVLVTQNGHQILTN